MVKCIQKTFCSQAASPQARLGTLERAIHGLLSMMEAEKPWVILPDFLKVTFTLKKHFALNSTGMNEREGKGGVAEPGQQAVLCSLWPQCHHTLLPGHKRDSRGAGASNSSPGQRAGTHRVSPTSCARSLNPHGRAVCAPAHQPPAFHNGVETA